MTCLLSGGSFCDEHAHAFLEECSGALESCLAEQADSLARGDLAQATSCCEQARRLTAVWRDVQRYWPWPDVAALEKSWQQYTRGELMDFETFKHELLKSAQ